MGLLAAARIHDTFTHTSLFAQILKVAASVGAGLLVGLAVGAAAALIVGTGGLGAIVLGAVVGAVIGVMADAATSAFTGKGSLEQYLSDMANEVIDSFIPGKVEGAIATGSQDVLINGQRAARAAGVMAPPLSPGVEPQSVADIFTATDLDFVSCSNHPSPHGEHMAEGSSSVFINGHPASRIKDKTTCDGSVNTGSPNVSIGGETVAVREIRSEMPPWLATVAKYAGLAIALCQAVRGKGPLASKVACFAMNFAVNAVAGEVVNAAARRMTSGRVGHPVHLPTGAKLIDGDEDLDFTLDAPIPVIWQRFYSSLDPRSDGPLGKGWSLPYSVELNLWVSDGTHPHEWIDAQGRRTRLPHLRRGEKTYSRIEGMTFACTSGGHWMVEHDDGLCMDFGQATAEETKQFLRPWVIEDRNSNRLYLRHDDERRLVGLATMSGHTIVLAYDAIHRRRVSEVTLHMEGEAPICLARYAYSEAGQLAAVRNAAEQITREYGYDADGRMIMHRLPGGLAAFYRWEQFERTGLAPESGPEVGEARIVEHWSDAGDRYLIAYDFEAQTTFVRDHLGRETRCVWNEAYLVTAHTDALGHTWRFGWSGSRELLSMTDPMGAATRIEYDDERGLPTRVINAIGEVTEIAWHPRWAEPVCLTSADGSRWQYEYDRLGNRVAQIDPLKQRTEWCLNRAGQPVARIDARGGMSHFGWDRLHRLMASTDCSGNTTRLTHDGRGRMVEIRDALGHGSYYGYDALDRIVRVRHPDGSEECYAWQLAGLVSHRDGGGRETRFAYDKLGRVVSRRDGNGHEVNLQYDAAGNLSRLINASGKQYRFGWDAADRLMEQAGVDDVLTTYQRDALGYPSAVCQGAGTAEQVTVRFERDRLGRLTLKTTPLTETSYRYDAGGYLIEIARRDAQDKPIDRIELKHDALGRLLSECTEWSGEPARCSKLEHGYDELGNRTSLQLADGHRLEWMYYGSGHLHRATHDGEVVSDFERDALHREVARTQGALTLRTAWDSRGRRVGRWTGGRRQAGEWGRFARGEDSLAKAFAYDASGELIKRLDPIAGELRFAYDRSGQLLRCEGVPQVGVLNEQFVYDAAANLLAAGQVGRIEGNRLVMSGDSRFRYDGHGRLVEKLKGSHTRQKLFWNAEHQLEAVVTVRHGVEQRVRYCYDALGRRVSKEDAFGETRFLWDGLRLLQEARGYREATYLYEGGSYEPLARIDSVREDGQWLWRAYEQGEGRQTEATARAPAQIYHFHTNSSGAPEELTDRHGRVVWRTRYRAWGNVVLQEYGREFEPGRRGEVEKPLPQSLRLQGQYEDAETGLHYNLFRYYDPDVGRFVSQDPIGLLGGFNLYQYAPNPVQWIDPLGLSSVCCCKGSYGGAKQASQYLKDAGVPRARRKEIMESFDVGTIDMRNAGASEYGLRYYDESKAYAKGRYLFETFPASRESLAVKPEWNDMTKIQQWNVREGEPMIEGRASAQGPCLPGGQVQKFILNLDALSKP